MAADSPNARRSKARARILPAVPLALAVSLGVVIDRYAAPLSTRAWLLAALACGTLGIVAGRRANLAVAALATGLLALAGGWHHANWYDRAGDDLSRSLTETPRPAWVRGVLLDVPGFRPGGGPEGAGVTRALLEVSQVHSAGAWRAASGRALVSVNGNRSDLRAGSAVEAAGSLSTIAGPGNPGEFDFRAFERAQGVRLRLSVDGPNGLIAWGEPPGSLYWRCVRLLGRSRAWSQEQLARGLDPSVAPLAAALLLGRRDGVDPDLNDAFARTGTTHLLAISGLHLQVLALTFAMIGRALGAPRRGTAIAVGLATLAYALLVGLMPSVVRSASMTVTVCLAVLGDRRSTPTSNLAFALVVTLGLNPSNLFDVGCQLSFLAVGAIAWAVGPTSDWVLRDRDPFAAAERHFAGAWALVRRKVWVYLLQGLTVSMVVWLAAIPLVALTFHVVSPIGVLLNVPLVPLTSIALLAAGCSLGLSAVWPPLAWLPAEVCTLSLRGTEAVVRWGAAQTWGHAYTPAPPWWWVSAFYVLLGLTTAAYLGGWKGAKWYARTLAASLPVGLWLTFFVPARAEADVLSVGHGLAVVVPTATGRALLYDCGRMRDPSVARRVIAPALWSRGVRRLDAVILSHADADHFNGLPDLMDRIPVDAVLIPPGFDAGDDNPAAAELIRNVRARGVPVREVVAGERWTAPVGFRFEVLHPPENWNPRASDNARSVVLDVSLSKGRLLLTGDLDAEGLTAVTTETPGEPIDVFLSPHHGGRTANPPWLYDWAQPKTVVVSQRVLPPGSRDPLSPLDEAGIPVFRTWKSGAVRLRWTPDGVKAAGFLEGW